MGRPSWIDRANHAGDEPPRRGRGASTAVWHKYATGRGYVVPAKATRDQIIAIVDAGPPTQQGDEVSALASSLEETIDQLRRMRRIEDVDAAKIALVRGLVGQLERDSTNAAMWRQYREALDDLIGSESALDDDELQKFLDGGASVDDTSTA